MTDKKQEEQPEFDFGGHMKHLEDAQDAKTPIGEGKTFTDSELEDAGIIKTSAYVRSKRSKNALRQERAKAKKAEQGIKQLNVEVPQEHRDTLKAFSKGLKEGLTPKQAFEIAIEPEAKITPQKAPESVSESKSEDYVTIGKKVAEIQSQGGLRAFILNRLI